jgi:hypothetical protein
VSDVEAPTTEPGGEIESSGEIEPSGDTRPRWKRVVRRVGIGVGVTLLVLALLGALTYSFGGMERPRPEFRTAYATLVSQGTAPPAQSRFTIPIPGCRCHSTDPVQQITQSTYRIRECRSGH